MTTQDTPFKPSYVECVDIIKECIETKLYLHTKHFGKFSKFLHNSATGIPHVALLNQLKTDSSESLEIKVPELLNQLKLKKLNNYFADNLPKVEVCTRHLLITSRHDTRLYIYVDHASLVAAYVFYRTLEGDFLSNIKKLSPDQLSKKRFYKFSNPHLIKQHKEFSILDMNEIIILAFCYIEFILMFAKAPVKKATKRSKFYIEPSVIHDPITPYTNNAAISKSKNMNLGCHEISDEERNAQLELFTFAQSYNGWGTDDWLYFRSWGGSRWAVSPALGIWRKLRIDEYYNVN